MEAKNYNQLKEISSTIAGRFKLNPAKVEKWLKTIDSDPLEAYFKVVKMENIEIISGVIAV